MCSPDPYLVLLNLPENDLFVRANPVNQIPQPKDSKNGESCLMVSGLMRIYRSEFSLLTGSYGVKKTSIDRRGSLVLKIK